MDNAGPQSKCKEGYSIDQRDRELGIESTDPAKLDE
jgi:hypothetical protein